MKRSRGLSGDDFSFLSDKRTKGEAQLHHEYERQISRLNQAFRSWIENNFKVSCKYLFAILLRERFKQIR